MLILTLFSLLLVGAMVQAQNANETGQVRVTRSVEVVVNGPVEKVFQLFTPEGETHWIPTWKYTPVYPASGETVRDMVFRTNEETLWTLAVYEPSQRSVYVHTSPDVLARIEVNCRAIDAHHTAAKVTWVFTALTDQGRAHIEHHDSEAEYVNRAKSWTEWLGAYATKAGWAK